MIKKDKKCWMEKKLGEVKLKLSLCLNKYDAKIILCLTKHHVTRTYKEMEVWLHTILTVGGE